MTFGGHDLPFVAKYLQNGQNVEIEENGGLLDAVNDMDFLPGFSLEGSFKIHSFGVNCNMHDNE